MENQEIIYKIKSIYIIKIILKYLKDNQKQGLFIYSKYFQNQLNIEYIDAKEKYLKNIGFNTNEYLYMDEKNYEKNILNKKYDKFLSEKKINRESLENLIYEIFENKQIKGICKENKTYINIDSPLFEIISKLSNFEKNYTIYISQKNIDEFNLLNEYNKLFGKLNKSNIKYISILYSSNYNETQYLKQLNIDYNKIIKLILQRNGIQNLKFLEYINIKDLKELNLSENNLSDISVLEKLRFEKLEKLNLSSNYISNNINIL